MERDIEGIRFPSVADVERLEIKRTGQRIHTGLTLREYYAGQAIAGLLASTASNDQATNVRRAISFADALIKALEEHR